MLLLIALSLVPAGEPRPERREATLARNWP
jgi:hypothetical protein